MKRWYLLVLGALVAIALAIACAAERKTGTSDEGAVDTELMAFLSEARALHHEANLKEDSGDVAGAIGAMERLTQAQRPHPSRPAPEVDEVLGDAYARLAELRLKKGDLDQAAESVARGLEHTPDPTYFKGHLLEVKGLVEETRAAQLTDAGKPEEAEAR
jgi:tetratricopeptide (TPR) repeat protein